MSNFANEIASKDSGLALQMANHEEGGWKLFTNRFVCFFDIAGFKKTSDYLYYSYGLLNALKYITDQECKKYIDNANEYLYIIAISDSIIVFSKDDSIESFCCFSHTIGTIFNKCILLNRVMTAAVDYGELFVDKTHNNFGGLPYNRAYQSQEQMNYYGILCNPSLQNYFIKNSNCQNEHYLYYKSNYLTVDSYKKNDSIKRELNYMWYNSILYGEVIESKILWGQQEIKVCSNDPHGIVVGNYFDYINQLLENYDTNGCNKIKQRLNNTMKVVDSMLKEKKLSYKPNFHLHINS